MSDGLTSVGVDVGTTTTQLIVSRLQVQNQAGAFAVPEMVITDRDIVYQSPVYFTPLLAENLVDGAGLREIVAEEYRKAGLRREDVDTGAIIITGETSRKENARAVLEALSEFAGDFVVATAGPDLESVLAAKGAGAAAFSEQTGKRVLHMDIGGGTSNLALIEDGKILETGCLNVGGRLLKFDRNGKVTYVSPVLNGICQLKIGDHATQAQVEALARTLVQALEMAAGLREKTQLLDKLTTEEARIFPGSVPESPAVISFPAVWRIVSRIGRIGSNSGIWARFWDRKSGKACCAGASTGWGIRPSGLRLSARGVTARSSPAARCFIKMWRFR